MDIQCPVCKTDGVVEDMGDHPDFLSGYCDECGASYAYSVMAGKWVYIDTNKVMKKDLDKKLAEDIEVLVMDILNGQKIKKIPLWLEWLARRILASGWIKVEIKSEQTPTPEKGRQNDSPDSP